MRSLYAVLDKYREITPPDVREEAKKYRSLPIKDAVELLALMLLTHGYALSRIVEGDTSGFGKLDIGPREQ